MIALVNFFNIASIALLINGFFHPARVVVLNSAGVLLRHGTQIWITNILVFALWFWEMDGDGPEARAHASAAGEARTADFLFPQMTVVIRRRASRRLRAAVEAAVFRLLYVAFTNATAFSPADVLPLTRTAKGLMLIEALISLATIGIVLARSVSLIQ